MKNAFVHSQIIAIVILALISTSNAYSRELVNGAKQEKRHASKAFKRVQRSALIREKLSFSFGASFSQGEYGADKTTDTYSIPFRLSYGRKDWRVSAQIPYVYADGPASVIAISNGSEIVDKIAVGERQRWGNGDLRISAQHQLFNSAKRHLGAYAGLTVKVPIASEDDGLGSGEFDHSFFAGGHFRAGNWISNGRLGYQLMGDTSQTNYNNRWYSSLGGYYRMGKLKSVGLNFYYKQASTNSRESIKSLASSFNLRIKNGWRTSFSLGAGFTDASSDLFAGVQFTKSFVRKRRISSHP